MPIETEFARLEELRGKYRATNAAILEARNKIAGNHRQIADARIEAILNEKENPPRVVEGKIKKLESEIEASEEALSKLTPEAAAISGAIAQLEAEVMPRRHAQRLSRQSEIQAKYHDLAARLIEAANTLASLSREADALYNAASSEFPKDELYPGQEVVRRYAGLQPIVDPQWVDHGNGSRRDVVFRNLWAFDRALVPTDDPVAVHERHQEDFRRQWSEEQERQRQERLNPPAPKPPAPQPPKTLSQRLSGELVPNSGTIRARAR